MNKIFNAIAWIHRELGEPDDVVYVCLVILFALAFVVSHWIPWSGKAGVGAGMHPGRPF